MDDLPGWRNASAVVLSCPGPLRRHGASLMPMAEVALPQVLLGAESQLLAFAASAEGLAGRLFFAPFPEMFPDARSLRAAWRRAGGGDDTDAGALGGARLVHLRFGSVRAARVLKGVRNGCVVAEAGGGVPLTASHHPFASGMVLPAAIRRVFVYGPGMVRPRSIEGHAVPASRLAPSCVTADLASVPQGPATAGAEAGLELVSLAEFRSFAWAAGPVRGRGVRAELAAGHQPAVLLPWNMDHPGSIVPDLLERLARLHAPRTRKQAGKRVAASPVGLAARTPRVILLPFNYVGQTGIIRRLIGRLREAAHDPEGLLAELFLARLGTRQAIGALRQISTVAWVDGNDPEHWWTLARLSATGIAAVLIDPASEAAPAGGLRLAADESLWVEAETRCGTLTFPARLPSLRSLPGLLAMTAALSAAGGPRPAERLRPRRATSAAPPVAAAAP